MEVYQTSNPQAASGKQGINVCPIGTCLAASLPIAPTAAVAEISGVGQRRRRVGLRTQNGAQAVGGGGVACTAAMIWGKQTSKARAIIYIPILSIRDLRHTKLWE